MNGFVLPGGWAKPINEDAINTTNENAEMKNLFISSLKEEESSRNIISKTVLALVSCITYTLTEKSLPGFTRELSHPVFIKLQKPSYSDNYPKPQN